MKDVIRKLVNHKIVWAFALAVLVLASFILGTRAGGRSSEDAASLAPQESGDPARVSLWTCSMHPQIKLPNPGKCPICYMDLIPLEPSTAGDSAHPRRLVLSESARRLAAITTVPVSRLDAAVDVRMVGKVAVDESRIEVISARMAGRIDELFLDSTGISVRRGDKLALLYSPELFSLQQELILASAAVSQLSPGASDLVRANAQKNLEAAKEKHRLLGFSDAEMKDILGRSAPADQMTIVATQSGVVLDRMATQGAYVEAGMPLFHIADLSRVWIVLEAYETDLAWLRLGQRVDFALEAFPGETFSGTVIFIDPVVDPMARTVNVRVTAGNEDRRLKPEMFVRARIKAGVSASGQILNASLRGKWICPVHPQIVKDGPGTCDIGGTPLVPAESLGYVTSGIQGGKALVVPATAPLFTGERAVVYVEAEAEEGMSAYEGREIVVGPKAGDFYIVKSGLSEGEKVVINGAFRIDSELQIRAKPSMMNPEGGTAPAAHHAHEGSPPRQEEKRTAPPVRPAETAEPDEFSQGLDRLYAAYFGEVEALATDDLEAARRSFVALEKARAEVAGGQGGSFKIWEDASKNLAADLAHGGHVADLEEARVLFERVSGQVISLEKAYGHSAGDHHLVFCPMAFGNKGAFWLQPHPDVRNPYFGSAMLRCGEIKESFGPKKR